MQNVTSSSAPSVIIFNAFDQSYVNMVRVMVAPLLMGTFTDLFLQGIIVVQMTNYFAYRDADGAPHRFKWLVILLASLCALKSFQNIVIVWNSVITTYANPAASYGLISGSWVFYTTGLSTAIIATVVQTFFAYRYWKLTKRWYICVIMLLGMVVSLVAAALVPVYVPSADVVTVSKWSLVHFVAAIIVDGLITVGTAFYLHSRKPGVQSTTHIIDRLVRMTWQSALPPAICVTFNAVLTEAYKSDLSQIALNMTLPKLYAISLMYTLNMRNEMRGTKGSHEASNGGGHITLAPKQTGAGGGLPMGGEPFDGRNVRASMSIGAIEAGNGTRHEKPGVRFLGGHALNFSRPATRRVDGVHVETHVATDVVVGSRNTIEMHSFQVDEQKDRPRTSEDDSDDWIQDRKYNSP